MYCSPGTFREASIYSSPRKWTQQMNTEGDESDEYELPKSGKFSFCWINVTANLNGIGSSDPCCWPCDHCGMKETEVFNRIYFFSPKSFEWRGLMSFSRRVSGLGDIMIWYQYCYLRTSWYTFLSIVSIIRCQCFDKPFVSHCKVAGN